MTTRRSKRAGSGFQVVVMAKAPVSGSVKTRLCPPLTFDQAAALAEAALLDTIAAVSASGARRRVLAVEGRLATGVPLGFDVMAQRAGDFGSRLAGAVDDVWARDPLPVVVIGMDTPQLRGPDLDSAAEALLGDEPDGNRLSAVLGPAEDGGYWAIGTLRPVPGMFDGVPMSTERTGAAQLSRLRALGVACTVIGPQRDVDEIDDALAVAALAPTTRFAATLRPMVGRRLPPVPAMAPSDDHDPVAMGQR
jgi:rSAM/selenodomain-associated transferase 1